MQNVLKLEELVMFIFSFFLFTESELNWWWFFVLLLLPDISMAGYAFGNKAGAILYNIFHHKGLGISLICVGFYLNITAVFVSGVILFGHSSMDRLFGYGLKLNEGFKFTHLGEIGK